MGCLSATATCGLAVASVQPSEIASGALVGERLHPVFGQQAVHELAVLLGIIACSLVSSSSDEPRSAPSYVAGITTSTPYGRPATWSSIHFSSSSSSSGVK